MPSEALAIPKVRLGDGMMAPMIELALALREIAELEAGDDHQQETTGGMSAGEHQ